ncbi:MAG TPA: bifunctional adenosylcobinamide kinase/adenosylcobinamide-phosphate guanylyltransferase [Actinomycetes bacterium]|jgi:histidinol-phosphate/aromatic aminotransferase/cobyric acid decarboxylase-like protein/adenosyl cobinamide kinase/adenosyl cobinamide phosphate guanylyltransferase|nr:bifunctional adenosylcobinamide kinase/adenosylcobinamide-phosphate guanylyltransferase [Actinomycetes bacterium]
MISTTTMAELILVLGGTRSGKSAVAESLVAGADGVRSPVVYVATGSAGDAEMAERIAAHRARRPPGWRTVETQDPAAAVRAAPPGSAVLVDALGLWLAARLDAEPGVLLAEVDALAAAAAAHHGGPVVVVAEEAGLGVVPAGAATRRWLDLLGEAKQRLAAVAARTLLVVAGHPLTVSPPTPAEAAGGYAPGVHGDRLVPEGALDFAANVRGPTPAHVRQALDRALDLAAGYPDDAAGRAAVAGRHRRPAGEVLVTAGATDAFHVLARVVGARLACMVHPGFSEPETALRAAGVPVTYAFRAAAQGWRLDPTAVDDRADVVVVGNPNNPTGTLDDAERVAALCRPGRVTVVDEAFMDFVEDEPSWSLAGRRDLPGLVVVRSVTKLWGLAGVRAGYLLGPAGLVARCAAARPPWATSTLALAAVEVCAGDERHRRQVAREVAAAREALAAGLRALPGVTVHHGAANFLLVGVPDGPAVHAGLLERGVAVRPPTFPGLGPDHLRVAVRDEEANRLLVKTLEEVLGG